MNIEKLTEIVPIFGTTGANGREHHKVKNLKDLQQSGVNFNTYTIREGETLRFPKLEDMEIEWVAVRKGQKAGYYIVKCQSEIDGKTKTTWFGLPALSKRDVDNNPVNPSWYELGDDFKRVEALAKVGEITGVGTIKIKVPVFTEDGQPKFAEVLNEDGSPVIENGVVKTERAVREQSVVLISDYVEPDVE